MQAAATQQGQNGNGHAAQQPQALRSKIQFATNVPTIVRLESDGELQPGRFGDQYRYFLGSHGIMWVEPDVHAKIEASGAEPGDDICITKRETRKGNRKGVAWEVELVQDEPAESLSEPAPPAVSERAAETPMSSPHPNPLAQALILAIDAVEVASRHAMAKYDWDEGLRLGEDAIVKLAITAYIQSQGGKQARA